jgi:hypothetical protein
LTHRHDGLGGRHAVVGDEDALNRPLAAHLLDESLDNLALLVAQRRAGELLVKVRVRNRGVEGGRRHLVAKTAKEPDAGIAHTAQWGNTYQACAK